MKRGRVVYTIGNEHNPTSSSGRRVLVIEPDGAARLDHYMRGPKHEVYTGRFLAFDRLGAALERAHFPQWPPHKVPPDAAIGGLKVEADGESLAVSIERRAAGTMPGYAEAFDLLDKAIAQLRGEAPAEVVTDVESRSK